MWNRILDGLCVVGVVVNLGVVVFLFEPFASYPTQMKLLWYSKKSFFNENEFISEIINNNEILYYSTEWSKSVVNLSEENLFSESYETSGTLTENNVISYLDI